MTRSFLPKSLLAVSLLCLPAVFACMKTPGFLNGTNKIALKTLTGDTGRVWRLATDEPSLVKSYITHFASPYTGRDTIRFDSSRDISLATQYIRFNARTYVISDSLATAMSLVKQGSWHGRLVGADQFNAIFLTDARLDVEVYYFSYRMLVLGYEHYDAALGETILYKLGLYPD